MDSIIYLSRNIRILECHGIVGLKDVISTLRTISLVPFGSKLLTWKPGNTAYRDQHLLDIERSRGRAQKESEGQPMVQGLTQ